MKTALCPSEVSGWTRASRCLWPAD